MAKLLPGIDLYICPRSDKIITLLAKHGSYNGKRAVKVNKDSLIGCVVWKKNQVNPSSSALVSVGPEKSYSDSPYQRVSVRGQSSKSGFDFGNSSGLRLVKKASDSLKAGKEHSGKGIKHMDGSQHKKVCRNDNISNLPLVIGGESRDIGRPYSTPVATPVRRQNPKKQPIPVTRQFSDYPTHPAAAQNQFSREYASTDQPPFHARTPQIVFNGPVYIASHALPMPLDSMFGSMFNPLNVTPLTSVAPSGLCQSNFSPHPGNVPLSQTPDDSHNGNVLTSSMGMNCDQPLRSNSNPDKGKLPIKREVRKRRRS